MTQRTKSQARTIARATRQSLATAPMVRTWTQAANDHLVDYITTHIGGGCVAAYSAIAFEIDPKPALLALLQRGYTIALPVVQATGQALRFRTWTRETPMRQSNLGIPEPTTGAWVCPDTMVVPLLAYNSTQHRLGYGGGFYDRTLAALRHKQHKAKIIAIGFAFSQQYQADMPTTAWDQKLDIIITETGVL